MLSTLTFAHRGLTPGGVNYTSTVIDEIALEGLDGITLQGLWVRLSACPDFPINIDPDSQRFIWELIKRLQNLSFYELPIERSSLVLFNRFDFIDPELGNVLEPEIPPEDIYPHKLVDDQVNGIMGSCRTYDERRDITQQVRRASLEEATRLWGARLVIVASQVVRTAALMGNDVDPCLELSAMHYCILERIGRARYHGEVTQGKVSLQCTGEEPKSLFYYRKTLQQHKLITKQVFHLKISNTQNCTGSLLHLPRFFTEHKPTAFYLTEKVVELLKTRPNYIAEYDDLRAELGLNNALKKLFKTLDFQRYVKTDLRIPYRTLYPDASRNEWKHKGSDKEKMIRVVQLINPHVTVRDDWLKEEEVDDEEEENGFLDESSRLLDRALMSQAYRTVDLAGANGMSQMELAKALGQTKLQARALCRNLLRRGLVSTFMNDVGRQRVSRYCSKRFDQSGHLSQQFRKERDKMMSLVNSTKSKAKRKADDMLGEKQGKVRKIQTFPNMHSLTATPSENMENSSVDVSQVEVSQDSLLYMKMETDCMAHDDYPITDMVQCEYNNDAATNGNCDSQNENLVNVTMADEEDDSDQDLGPVADQELPDPDYRTPKRDRAAGKGMPRKKKKKMNTKPAVTWSEKRVEQDQGITTEILIGEDISPVKKKDYSSSFTAEVQDTFKNQKKEAPGITTRILRRANIIMEAVQEHKVINDLTKLQKLIHEEEEKEGVSTKIDKKSLLRLLEKLGKDGHIKNIRVLLRTGAKEKALTFVCEPNITTDNGIIKSSLEQAKMKMNIPTKDRFNQTMHENAERARKEETEKDPSFTQFDSESIHRSITEMNQLQSVTTPKPGTKFSFKRNAKLGKQYGFQPKFVRMKTMHQFLFYLVYAYSGNPDLDQHIVMETLSSSTPIPDELASEMSQVFYPAIDWRMFVPPLPRHVGWPDGWTIMCDILLRLPLSIFLRLVNINYEVPGLDDYLSHPIKKHFLVKHLPADIRSQLTAARRYIFNCHEVVTRLCYIGLAQMGPQRLKEKDQVFIFLNKNTSILDTIPSPAGYHQISDDMEYKVLRYHFDTSQDVDHYWYEMWNICVNTSLGGRMCVSGKDIMMEVLENKPAMLAAVNPRTPEEAVLLDNGAVPGDHRGAAGLDSAMFSHLKRNWHWSHQQVNDTEIDGHHSTMVDEHISQMEPLTEPANMTPTRKVLLVEKSTPKQMTTISTTNSASRTDVASNSSISNDNLEASVTPSSTPVVKKRSSRKDRVRTMPMPRASRKKPYYDQADKEALTLMSKLRVEWTAPEDNLLLLCKVAVAYLNPNVRAQTVGIQVWRDILHKAIPGSRNKTSRAVQRRILYMMKNPSTARSVSLCLEEIKQDPVIQQQFGDVIAKIKSESENSKEKEKRVAEKFTELVNILQGRFQNMRPQSTPYEKALIPDCPTEFREKFIVASPAQTMRVKGRFQPVKTTTDIHAAVINAMIYSSLCCMGDKTSWAYQLFKVYQQYPDALLRSAMSKIRADQMVSMRKSYARTKMKSGNFLPVSNCPYQLSISYLHLLQNRYQYEIFQESFEMLQKLAWDMLMNTDVNGLELMANNGGSTATFIEYLIKDKISFQITIPDQLIILDPRISQKDETYARIVARYRAILRNCKVRREMATSASLFKKPYLDILERDEVWETGGETESEAETEEKKKQPKKSGGSTKSSSSGVDSGKKNGTQASGKLSEVDTSEVGSDDSEDDGDSSDSGTQRTQQSAIARAASRIALYMMRGEGDEPNVSKVQETQHAHDFFVVNSCKVVGRLKEDISKDAPVDKIVGIDPKGTRVPSSISQSLLPVSSKMVSEVLDNLKQKAVFSGPEGPEEEVLKSKGADSGFLETLTAFILSKKELGATFSDLREYFPLSDRKLALALTELVDLRLVLRTGVTTAVFVHHTKVRPWLIHSRKLLRLNREKLQPSDGKAVMLKPEAENEELSKCVTDLDMEVEEVEETPDSSSSEEDEDACDPSNQDRTVMELRQVRTKKGTARLTEVSPSSLDKLDNVPSDQIRVLIRPWVRVDGGINRRVLDRLLGSVLGHCMANPGSTLVKIGERFSPALQPVHTRELCEVLQQIGCLQWKVLKRSHKVTLFSKPRIITIDCADGTENECDIIIEPVEDAVLRLSLFIGEKAYSKDFLSSV